MSKLEDKLAASIKPAQSKPAARKTTPARSKPNPEKIPAAVTVSPPKPVTQAAPVVQTAAPEPPSQVLHPRRVWPD